MRKLLLTTIVLSIFLSSCKKDPNDDVIGTGDLSSLVVPASFNWQTARDVNFNISTHDTRFQNGLHIIEVFQGGYFGVMVPVISVKPCHLKDHTII